MEVIKGRADKRRDLSPLFLAAGRSLGLMRKEISSERREEYERGGRRKGEERRGKRRKEELVGSCGSSLGIASPFVNRVTECRHGGRR